MKSMNQDNEFLRLLGAMIAIDGEIEAENRSPIRAVHPVDKKKQLEKKKEDIHDQYMALNIKLDRIRIREIPSVEFKYMLDILRKCTDIGPLNIYDYWDHYHEEIIAYHEDHELLDRGDFIGRYYQLTPPYVKVGTIIPEGIKNIYHESRWCFVYGQYNSTIAMCRTIIETVLKIKFHLSGDLTLKDIIETAKERRLISYKTKWNADRVRILANKILHRAEPVSEKEAKEAIGCILVFLEEIYL